MAQTLLEPAPPTRPWSEMRAVPQRAPFSHKEVLAEFESALGSVGLSGVEAQLQKATSKTATSGAAAKGMDPPAPTTLEVPPLNTEPEERHPTYKDMEEIGKNLRERKRREKSKDSPIEWREKSRLVRSGDGPMDGHCLPSTLEPGLGELVDQYRRSTMLTYLESSKLCREHNVHISEPMLQKGLLHPGDKIIKVGEHVRKIRQPGGYYTTGRVDALSLGSTCRSGTASGAAAGRALGTTSQAAAGRGAGAAAGRAAEAASRTRSQAKEAGKNRLQRSKKQRTNENRFWPGHLLDKLCLYFPDKQHDRAHALFSYVAPTKSSYRGCY